jgi:hypothetical protein
MKHEGWVEGKKKDTMPGRHRSDSKGIKHCAQRCDNSLRTFNWGHGIVSSVF